MINLCIQTCNDESMARMLNRLSGEKEIVVKGSIVIHSIAREAARGMSFMSKMVSWQPDVAVIDVSILREAAAMNIKQVVEFSKKFPETRTIILGDRFHEQNVIAMMRGGARGFLLREHIVDDIVKCIHVIARGEIWLRGDLVGRVCDELVRDCEPKQAIKSPSTNQLSKMKSISRRELEILELVSESMTNEEIAQKLFLSAKTVKTHIRNIFEKTGIRNRVEAALLYTRYKHADAA